MSLLEYHNKFEFDDKEYNFKIICTLYYNTLYKNIKNLSELHKILPDNKKIKEYYDEIPIFGINDRKSPFVLNFHKFIDTDYTFLHIYTNFINNVLKPILNVKKIIVQKTPNIRFHLPNNSNIGKLKSDPDSNNFIGVHKDRDFGHNPNEYNVIIPLTNMYDTNSFYYENEPNSNQKLETYNSFNLKTNEFYITYLNNCIHYNKINKTNKTRVSLDFRIIFNQDIVNDKNENISNDTSVSDSFKFKIGEYYMLI